MSGSRYAGNPRVWFDELIVCVAALFAAGTAFAATYTWTGGAGDGLFSTPGNWDGGTAPTAATADDALAFATGGSVTNDIAGLTVGDVGVTLAAGTQLTITGGKFGGTGTLTKDGAGKLLFNATNMPNANYSQKIAVNGGVLQIGVGGDFYGALAVADGATMLCSSGTINFRGPVQIDGGATNTGAQVHYYTKVKGNPACANAGNTTFFHGGLDGIVTIYGGGTYSGQAVFYEDTSCFHGYFRTSGECTVNGNTGELVRKKDNMFVGNKGNCVIGGITVNGQHNFGGFGDDINDTVLITNSNISVTEAFSAGRLGPVQSGNKAVVRLGKGTTVTSAYLLTGYNMWPNFGAIEILDGSVVNVTNRVCVGYHYNQSTVPKGPTNEWITVDGGTLNAPDCGIGIGFRGPQSSFFLKNGIVNAKGIYLKGYRAKGGNVDGGGICIGGTNTFRYVQTGGTLNLGSWGFMQHGREDNGEANIYLSGGTLNAVSDFSIPSYIPTLFGTLRGGSEGGFTLNTAGNTVTLRTALNGAADVTLTGGGTIVGDNAMQGALGGKWTVDGGMTADLRGAASFLGGLAVGQNASVTLDVGAGRSAAFYSRDGSWPLTAAYATNNILARFNKSDGGTVSSLISHDMGLWNASGESTEAVMPHFMGNTRESLVSKGEFYVDAADAGTWTFCGNYKDNLYIQIDDQSATSTSSSAYATLQIALSAGWHRFVVITVHNTDNFGPTKWSGMAVGFAKKAVSGTAQTDYTPFDPAHLTMRPSAPVGGTASVRWSTYFSKNWGKVRRDDGALPIYSYTHDWLWDAVSLTNSLKGANWYGKSGGPERFTGGTYIANRWDGWFHVPFERAGTWRFKLQFYNSMRFYLDGVDIGGVVNSSNPVTTGGVAVTPGWHRYEIRTYRHNANNSGPKDGTAVAYAVKTSADADFGEFVPFDEDSLTLALMPDGYMQGDITLASGATVTNVSDEPAVVWGDISAAGATGAILSGKFACVSNTVDFGTVAADTSDLTSVLLFENAATNLFADVGKIAIDFAEKPMVGNVLVGPAGGLEALSEAELAERVVVLIGGEPADAAKISYTTFVENGKLRLHFSLGTMILLR